MIDEEAYEQKADGQERALHDLHDADGPAGFVGVDGADLQADDHEAEDDGGPVDLAELAEEIAAPVQGKVQDDARDDADRISHNQGRKRVHAAGHRFGANLIQNVGQNKQ